MNPIKKAVAFCLALAAPWGGAQATSISASMTVDNAFYAYISTDDSVRGTLIGSGNNWPTTFGFSGALTSGVNNYLHIVAINYGGPGAFIGQFSLSDTAFKFANGTQSLLTHATNTTDWRVRYASSNGTVAEQPWVMPNGTDTVFSLGLDGTSPWGFRPGISDAAAFIWGSTANSLCATTGNHCTVSFSTTIFADAVPAPVSLALVGLGLIGLGALRRRAA